jgi:hypothetical protein
LEETGKRRERKSPRVVSFVKPHSTTWEENKENCDRQPSAKGSGRAFEWTENKTEEKQEGT